MKRTPLKRKTGLRSRYKPVPRGLREALVKRSGGFCEARLLGCLGRGSHVHEKLPRAHRGKRTPDNTLLLCAVCHSRIHNEPERYGYATGFLKHSWEDM